MPNPATPVKTPLGHQELRERTHGLGQRHRTVLLLVDGRRSLAEVLAMAHQAGAQTSHLESLVELGMIELPGELLPAGPERPIEAEVESAEPEAPVPAPEVPAEPDPVAAPALIEPALPVAEAVGPPVAEPVVHEPEPEAPREEEQMLAEVRRLLLDTLRRDTLLARVLAPGRVRGARTQDELIGLVWDIEHERAHARRKRGQLLNLQRARELLGMGNTRVAGDSLQGPPSVP